MYYTIETEIWEKVPNEPNKVSYVKQRPAKEVFSELEAYLTKNNLLPDEYFSLSSHLENLEFPKGKIICHADYGSSEGIYLDIDIVAEKEIIHFATGKTLADSEAEMDKMYKVASECMKVFRGVNVDDTTGLHIPNSNSYVKVVTPAEIISLTNTDKRKDFLADYRAWGVWLDISELDAKYFKAELPDGASIVVGEFKSRAFRTTDGLETTDKYCYIPKDSFYSPSAYSVSLLVDKLKDLRQKILKQQEGSGTQTTFI